MEERDVCVNRYLDFVQFHFEPVHSNLFFLISSYTRTSHPQGLLPKKQKVGESCSLQVLWLMGPLPEKCCSMVTKDLDPSALMSPWGRVHGLLRGARAPQ